MKSSLPTKYLSGPGPALQANWILHWQNISFCNKILRTQIQCQYWWAQVSLRSVPKSSVFPYGRTSLASSIRERIFRYSQIKKFPDRRATNPAANRFKFGALANVHAPSAFFTAPYSHEAAYQAYVRRLLGVTWNQGLLQQHSDIEGRNRINSLQIV